MAATLLDSSNCSALTGWTSVTPGGLSAVEILSGTLHSWKDNGTIGSGFNVLGAYRTIGVAVAAGHTIYWQGKTKSDGDCMWLIRSSAGIAYNSDIASHGPVGIYFDAAGNAIQVRNGTASQVGTGKTWANDTWYDFKAVCQDNGSGNLIWRFYYRTSDTPGTLDPKSSIWTHLGASTNAGGGDFTSQTVYFATNDYSGVAVNTNGMFTDEFYYYSIGQGYYATHKDPFDSDSGNWTDVTTNGTITIAGGKKSFAKATDDSLWTTLGHIRTVAKTFAKGDIAFWAFQLDDLDTNATNGTYLLTEFTTQSVVNSTTSIGAYAYPDGGPVKMHGNTSGICTDSTLSSALAGATTYIIRAMCNAVSGKLQFDIIGGAFSTWTTFAAELNDASPSGGNYSLRHRETLYSSHSDVSLLYYGWTDNGGPVPNDPSAPGASTLSSTSLQITWTNNENLDFINGFSVERSATGGGSGFSEVADVNDASVTTFGDTGLSHGTKYYYRIRGYLNLGGTKYYSNYTSEVNATTTLPAPSGLSVSNPTNTTLDLSWTDNSTGETGFKIERSTVGSGSGFSQIDTTASTTYTDTGRAQGTKYYYRVRAYTTDTNSAYSAEANGTTVLPAPSSLSVGNPTISTLDLSWTDNSTGETGFKIERSIVGGGVGFSQINTTASTTYTDTGLSDGVEYFYRVRAYTTDANSAYSAEDSDTTIVDNVAPVVNAGTDQTNVNLALGTDMNGSASDDHKPAPPDAFTITWTKQSGPGTVTFANNHSLTTHVGFSLAGTYVLRLTADDSDLQSHDDVTIIVNAAPIVDAGNDQEVKVTDTIQLDGSASDDHLPNPPDELTYTWSVVSKPYDATVVFSDDEDPASTASVNKDGIYILRLSVYDGQVTGTDEVQISVLWPLNLTESLLQKWRLFPDVPQDETFDETKRQYYRLRLAEEIDDDVANDLSVNDYMDQFFNAAGFGTMADGDLEFRERLMFISEIDGDPSLSWDDLAKIWASDI